MIHEFKMNTNLKHLNKFKLFIYLFIIYSHLLKINFTQCYTSLNNSEEIKRIFQIGDDSKRIDVNPKEMFKIQNFAEGGIVKEKTLVFNLTQNSVTNQQSSVLFTDYTMSSTKKSNNSKILFNHDMPKEKYNLSLPVPLVKQPLMTKLNDTGNNLFLGVPEVVHINGTSSIKPRKGVYFNKIVPRKGVDIEHVENSSILFNSSCFSFVKSKCYNASRFQNTYCICCPEDNDLAKKIKEQLLLNCTLCKFIKVVPEQKNVTCQNICCSNNLYDLNSSTPSHIQEMGDGNFPVKSKSILGKISYINQVIEKSKLPIKVYNNKNKEYRNFTQKLNMKPSITKVPYDVEIKTELSTKVTTKVFTPVIVSIFVLPLIGIPLFFLYKKTKEYWDKRYYKRMDFLIDGMYND